MVEEERAEEERDIREFGEKNEGNDEDARPRAV